MHGLGNDFMVIERLSQSINITAELVQQWANRRTGVGFDQLLVLDPPQDPKHDFQYIIYNSDGSEVGQCGNGARCIARFIADQKLCTKSEQTLATSTNTMHIMLEDGLAKVCLSKPKFKPQSLPFLVDQAQRLEACKHTYYLADLDETFTIVSVGNPHAVIFVDNVETIDIQRAERLQAHPCFPEGVNVGFAQILQQPLSEQPAEQSALESPSLQLSSLKLPALKLRVVERGAGETQACGSGACAAAIAAIETERLAPGAVQVILLGGELSIQWHEQQLTMKGPASRVYTGRLLVRHTNHSRRDYEHHHTPTSTTEDTQENHS